MSDSQESLSPVPSAAGKKRKIMPKGTPYTPANKRKRMQKEEGLLVQKPSMKRPTNSYLLFKADYNKNPEEVLKKFSLKKPQTKTKRGDGEAAGILWKQLNKDARAAYSKQGETMSTTYREAVGPWSRRKVEAS